jgi:hypothetical protein
MGSLRERERQLRSRRFVAGEERLKSWAWTREKARRRRHIAISSHDGLTYRTEKKVREHIKWRCLIPNALGAFVNLSCPRIDRASKSIVLERTLAACRCESQLTS